MGEDVTSYGIYTKFYAALINGEKVGPDDFYFRRFSGFGDIVFNEAQTAAVGIAIANCKSKIVFRTKKKFENKTQKTNLLDA